MNTLMQLPALWEAGFLSAPIKNVDDLIDVRVKDLHFLVDRFGARDVFKDDPGTGGLQMMERRLAEDMLRAFNDERGPKGELVPAALAVRRLYARALGEKVLE